MNAVQRIITGSTLALLIAATPAIAGKGKKDKSSNGALVVANTAIAQLAGLQTKAARKTLDSNKEKFGATSEFKTAWALLEAQEAGESGKGYAATGFKEISQMAKASQANPVASYWEGVMVASEKILSPLCTELTFFPKCVNYLIYNVISFSYENDYG